MSTGHLGEPVAGRDLLVRADWCREGAVSSERKASQASSRLCGAAGRQGYTSRCRLPLDRVMEVERRLNGYCVAAQTAGERLEAGLERASW